MIVFLLLIKYVRRFIEMKIIACILLKISVTALSFVLIINIDSASAEYAMSKNDNAEMYYHINSVETASSSAVTSQKNSDSGIIENKQEDLPPVMPTQLINKNEAVAPNNLELIQSTNAVLNCSVSGNLNWTSSSGVFGVIQQCTMNVQEDGWVLIKANGSMARSDGEYEALFNIGIDSTAGDSNIDRWVNVYNDSGDGTDESVVLSVIKPVTAGNHTFNFLGRRYAGSGTVNVFDPTLSVVFLPAQKMPNCSASGSMNWATSSATFSELRQCTMNVPEDGWVLITADGSMARSDGEYEASFSIGIDSTTGDPDIDRWVNVYNDSGDGTDKSVALSIMKHVTAGNHIFNFLGSRYTGSGTVTVYDPTLSVVFVPSKKMASCSASGNMTWKTTSSTFSEMRQCTMNVPKDSWVLITADGSMARSDGEYEALFNIGIDSTTGDSNIDRWVNVYNDSGDGTDESVALSVMKPVTAGNHTFNFLGRRYAGSGTVTVYDPTLSVVALVWMEKFPWPMFLPAIINSAQP
jgi:hypothetical protein